MTTMDDSRERSSSNLKIGLIVLFYFSVSISLVFLNKFIFHNGEFTFDFPLTVTLYQILVAIVLLWVLAELNKIYDLPDIAKSKPFTYDLEKAKATLPVTFIFVGMISMNNLCLKYVEVSFYQIARSLTILMTLGLQYMIAGEKTSFEAIMASAVVFAGFVLGSVGEVNMSIVGLAFGVTASVFVALNGIYNFSIMRTVHGGDEWAHMTHVNINAVPVFFVAIVLSGELGPVLRSPLLYNGYFVFIMTLAAGFGFLINIAILLLLKHTNPLTNTIAGTAKACVQTILSVYIWRNPLTSLNAIGLVLSLAGSGWYAFIKKRMKDAKAAAATKPTPATAV